MSLSVSFPMEWFKSDPHTQLTATSSETFQFITTPEGGGFELQPGIWNPPLGAIMVSLMQRFTMKAMTFWYCYSVFMIGIIASLLIM